MNGTSNRQWRRIGADDGPTFSAGAYQDPFTGTNRYMPGSDDVESGGGMQKGIVDEKFMTQYLLGYLILIKLQKAVLLFLYPTDFAPLD